MAGAYRCGKEGRDNQLQLQGGLNLVDATGWLEVSGDQGGQQTDQQSNS